MTRSANVSHWTFETHFAGIAFEKRHIANRTEGRSRSCRCDRAGGAIDSNDFTRFADQFRRHERNIARAAADIEHTHSPLRSRHRAKIRG